MTTGAPPRAASETGATTDGATLAAYCAAGIGAFAMGLFVLLNEAGLFAAPSLYGPAGGVSGRTTFAVATWLIAWGILHRRWGGRELVVGRTFAVTLALIALGVLGCFPPVWGLFG